MTPAEALARDWGRAMLSRPRVGYLLDEARIFRCWTCKGLFGWECGCADDHPDDCDRCANEKERERTGT